MVRGTAILLDADSSADVGRYLGQPFTVRGVEMLVRDIVDLMFLNIFFFSSARLLNV